VQKFLKAYLETEGDDMSSYALEMFLEQASEKYAPAAAMKMKRIGFMQGE